MKTTCHFCNKKAVFNLKHIDGIANLEGPTVQLGSEEKYYPTCYSCYTNQHLKQGKTVHAVSIDSFTRRDGDV